MPPNVRDALSMWTVYRHPRDFPDKYVARQSEVGEHGRVFMHEEVLLADTLEELRKLLPSGLYCLQRHVDDDPVIVEVWL